MGDCGWRTATSRAGSPTYTNADAAMLLLEARNPLLLPWRIDAALAHRACSETRGRPALSDEELAAARDWGTPGAIGAAQRLRGLLATGDEAIATPAARRPPR